MPGRWLTVAIMLQPIARTAILQQKQAPFSSGVKLLSFFATRTEQAHLPALHYL